MTSTTGFLATPLAFACLLTAQHGLLPNGNFENDLRGWNKIRFDDPAGSTGVALADVTGSGVSKALFADFRSSTRYSHADWLSDKFSMPPGVFPVRFSVLWDKPTATAVGDPSGNYVEVHRLDPRSRKVFTGHIPVPRTTRIQERRDFVGTVIVPAPGLYQCFAQMRHSGLAGMGYRVWIDEILVGYDSWSTFGAGCPGSSQFVPTITATGTPRIGSTDFKVQLVRAMAPTTAWLAVGVSRTSWNGVPLPLDLGGACAIQVSPEILLGARVSGTSPGTGSATISIPLPNLPTLRGQVFYSHWAVADPGSGSPTGLATSGGLAVQVQ